MISAVCTILFAGMIFGIFRISGHSSGSFIFACELVFLVLFASPVVSAALLVLTRIPEEWSMGFGAGLYYGTIFVSAITRKVGWVIPDVDRILLGAVISGLVCYAVYQNMMRKKDKW